MNKAVILLVYSLAPKKGVGARRWQKYAMALANKNVDVFIIGSQDPLNEYLNHPQIKYLTFKSGYPIVLDKTPTTFFSKIKYRLKLVQQKYRTKGAIYDRAALDEKQVVNLVINTISQYKIKNIIVSGAPFSLLYFGVVIKKKFKNLNLIADFRDAWTWGEGYGIHLLNNDKKKFEEFQEKEVVKTSDVVLVASEDLKKVLEKKYSSLIKKIKVLLNAIEFDNDVKHLIPNSPKIIITHIGSVNQGTEKYWVPLLNAISKFEDNIELRFIGGKNIPVKEYVLKNNLVNIKFIARVNESKLEYYFQNTNFVLMFKKDGFENTFPTKFFDYIKYEKFILAFTKSGAVARELEDNKIGKVFNESLIDQDFIPFIKVNTNQNFNRKYNKLKFSVSNSADFINSLLK